MHVSFWKIIDYSSNFLLVSLPLKNFSQCAFIWLYIWVHKPTMVFICYFFQVLFIVLFHLNLYWVCPVYSLWLALVDRIPVSAVNICFGWSCVTINTEQRAYHLQFKTFLRTYLNFINDFQTPCIFYSLFRTIMASRLGHFFVLALNLS